MPTTEIDFPILQHFLCAVESTTGMPAQPLDALASPSSASDVEQPARGRTMTATAPLPKGVVLGPDGKPCRSCTSVSAWMAMARGESAKQTVPTAPSRSATSASAPPPNNIPDDCPPDVDNLGRSTWTLLHALTAQYPTAPSAAQQRETTQFLGLLGKMYPCWTCAADFRAWMREEGNAPRVSDREEFGRWMCEAHNAVNKKLGKEEFDCGRWEERWRTGWRDGRCG